MLTNKPGRCPIRQDHNTDPNSERISAQNHILEYNNTIPQGNTVYTGTIDPFLLAERLGYPVICEPLPCRKVGGIAVSVRYKDGSIDRFIIINSKHGKNQQRFSLFHEIYHLLHHQTAIRAREMTGKGIQDNPEWEAEANAFASSMLMPEGPVRQGVKAGYTVRKMALAFGVTQAQMRARLEDLGLRNPYKVLLDRLEDLYPGIGEDVLGNFIESLPLGFDLTPFCEMEDNDLLEHIGQSMIEGEDVAGPALYRAKMAAAQGV